MQEETIKERLNAILNSFDGDVYFDVLLDRLDRLRDPDISELLIKPEGLIFILETLHFTELFSKRGADILISALEVALCQAIKKLNL